MYDKILSFVDKIVSSVLFLFSLYYHNSIYEYKNCHAIVKKYAILNSIVWNNSLLFIDLLHCPIFFLSIRFIFNIFSKILPFLYIYMEI